MPAWNRLTVSFALEQFFTPYHLRIGPIANLEPHALLTLCDVGSVLVLGYDSLQIEIVVLLLHVRGDPRIVTELIQPGPPATV
jgi:hypothetical protein